METCKICGKTAPDTDSAIEAGWIPTFAVSLVESPDPGNPCHYDLTGPACDACFGEHLVMPDDPNLDPVLKPGVAITTLFSTSVLPSKEPKHDDHRRD